MTTHLSSTAAVPPVSAVPRHIAIIMDGNGRWATKRFLPRVAGHVKGVEAVRRAVEACARSGVEYLTLFAFSSENWRRPADEVSLLMRLFVTALDREVAKMHANGIRLKVVGELSRFDDKLRGMISNAERRTAGNTGLTVTICANYGGRWDIMQAMNQLVAQQPGRLDFTEDDLAPFLSMAYAPEPDLFIRTGGEERVSNFLLWQLAYAEMFFTETYWPDFDAVQLQLAVTSYQQRERRFGRTSEQLVDHKKAS
ncbi:polyprenyl diphosphate synthase [Actimicrobium sp. CCC2.4]|uniref:polyprenyl diphosphate synthase n=1 Tax=Actimicrobium sp. CCC2.4 TaxID=3048606 RepID=UPI002AC8E43E|nr:polyprenyl diphosphate synthase [Actimicrobium sp. CCC2.4]MEB0134523.1 polyprenyl diphosphate synthase [Actimicrobium sp. CCC2.4]WPX33969.1 polyprenyl diphosphate synthase [Actimicrobium sp. CCC2.4]